MDEAAGGEWFAPAGGGPGKQAGPIDDFPDDRHRHAQGGGRLRGQRPRGLGRQREDEFEVLAVGEDVGEGRAAVARQGGHADGIGMDGDGSQVEHGRRVSGPHHPCHIERQSVADVDRRVDRESPRDPEGLVDAGRDGEVAAEQAASAAPGDDDQVAGPGPVAAPGGTLPMAVTLTNSGPSQALVSPPAGTSRRIARSMALPQRSSGR